MLARPLGKNRGGYCGETIDIDLVLQELHEVAEKRGWQSECFFQSSSLRLRAYHRKTVAPRKRIYISAGIHGDEPAAPLAVLALVKQDQWPDSMDVWLCPCLNPVGFELNRRENADQVDLNRDYRNSQSPEIRAHINLLKRCPQFDRAGILHEDWEARGFYLYELNPDNRPSVSRKIVQRVSQICPIDTSTAIDGFDASDGVIRPKIDPEERKQWPEAIFLNTNNTREGYTLEAPSDYPLPVRVEALVAGVMAVLD